MSRQFKSAMATPDESYYLQVVKLPSVLELHVIRGELLQLAEICVKELPSDLDEDGRFEELIVLEAIITQIAQSTPTPTAQWRLGVRMLLGEFVTVCKVMD